MATVQSHRPGRRVVHRARPTIENAWDVALGELPIELRPLARRYVEHMREGQQIRSEMTTALTAAGVKWLAVDRVARALL